MARVLVVSFSVAPGPDRQGVQLTHVLRALASRFTVNCLTVRDGDLAYVERFHKTRMLRVPMPDGDLGARVEAFRRALRRQLEGAEYDVVHFRDAWSGVPVLERASTFGYKTVFDASRLSLGEPGPDDVALEAEYQRGEDECLRRADLVLVPLAESLAAVARRGRTERVFVVPPGVDVDRFDEEAGSRGDGPPRILYAGGMAAGRGVRLILRAAREVAQTTPLKVVLAGPIRRSFAESLTQAIAQHGLEGSVESLGAIDNEDMPRVIARATLCIAPVAADHGRHPTAPCPTKILEYLACGRAVIAPRKSSVTAVIEDGREGLLFEPDNPISLAEAIARLLGDGALRTRLAEAGRQKIREQFPASVTRRRVLDAYTQLVPETQWSPLQLSAAPQVQGSSFTSTTNSQAELEPVPWDLETEVDEDAGGPPTAITAAPPGFSDSSQSRSASSASELGEDTARRSAPTPSPEDVSGRATTSYLGRDFVAGELQVPAKPEPPAVRSASESASASDDAPPATPPQPAGKPAKRPPPLPRDDTRATLPFARAQPPPPRPIAPKKR